MPNGWRPRPWSAPAGRLSSRGAGSPAGGGPGTASSLLSPPAALFSVPPVINRNSLTHFDGAGSSAEQGSKVARYLWDWDGDGYSDFDSTDSQLAHIFTVAGSASLGLKVVDDRGLESKWTTQNFTVLP